MQLQSASSLLRQDLQHPPPRVVSCSAALDKLLDGGFGLGEITQIAGESGSGKTQLCFQLCLDVQIPPELGGVHGEAIYIDTENSFESRRVCEMAESVLKHCNSIAGNLPGENVRKISMTVERFLSGIYLFRCLDIVQLLAASHQMFEFIKTHTKVKLIIVDSIAHCVRCEEDMRTRMKFLNTLAENFKKLAFLHNIAIVIVNQVTTKFCGIDGSSCIVPALGATWSYTPTTKLMLVKENKDRYVLLYKSPTQPRGVAQYCITRDGFRDVDAEPVLNCVVPDNKHTDIFTQATTADLLRNEFIEGDGQDTTESGRALPEVNEEDIPSKWLLLSQKELSVSHDKIKGEYAETEVDEGNFDVGHCSQTDVKSQSKKSGPSNEHIKKDEVISSEDDKELNEPPSPILITRMSRKRRRID